MEHEDDGDTNCNWCTLKHRQRIGKGTERFENKRTSGDYLDYSKWRLKETCCHSDSSEKPSAKTPVKNSQKNNNDRIMKKIGESYTKKKK